VTIQQRAQIERAYEEYMPLYDRYLNEPNPEIRQQLSNQMDVIGRKFGFDGGVGK